MPKSYTLNTDPWKETSEDMVRKLTTILHQAQKTNTKMYAVKKPIFSVGIKNVTNKTMFVQSAEWENPESKVNSREIIEQINKYIKDLEQQIKSDPHKLELENSLIAAKGKLYGQPCKPGEVIKANFIYDTQTKQINIFMYVNTPDVFSKKNQQIKDSKYIYKTTDETIREVSLVQAEQDYTLPWEDNLPPEDRTILRGDPNTHHLVSYPTSNGIESYPILHKEAVVTSRFSDNIDKLKNNAAAFEQQNTNEFKEILTLEKQAEFIRAEIEKQLKTKKEVSLDSKQITRHFNKKQENFLKNLPTATKQELIARERAHKKVGSLLKSQSEESNAFTRHLKSQETASWEECLESLHSHSSLTGARTISNSSSDSSTEGQGSESASSSWQFS